ncbi:MAG TPA: hypothetical protein VJX92_21470 [Methylomirabilota bacterium]|nr:hypothetical protein [Methylomirabilota bacterium]
MILWMTSLVLMSPAVCPYVTQYVVKRDDLVPTGFIHPDMPSYMANAREHFDAGHFRLTFSNPASVSYDSPAIYFQPFVLVLAGVWRMTNLSPGVVFMLLGFFAALSCSAAAVALYRTVIGWKTWGEKLGLVVFFWGGGVLALAGGAYKLLLHRGRTFQFDPADGWWFLNFGRNLILPTEALYHALFLSCILCTIKHSYRTALALTLLVALNHPFTGIELLAILCTWAAFEIYFVRSGEVPGYFLTGCVVVMIAQLTYYLWFLNMFPEHRSLSEDWALPWLLQAENFIPAYALVGGLAVARLRRLDLAGEVLRVPANRLFLIWFVVAFGLANHECAIAPRQPLHFTRGYCWTALFFLGAPLLVAAFEYLLARKSRVVGLLACAGIVVIFCSDNMMWFGSFLKREDQGVRLTQDEARLLDWLDGGENRGYVVVAREPELGHLTIVYTPLRAWLSHWETPERRRRQAEVTAFFDDGKVLDRWARMPLLFVFEKARDIRGQGVTRGKVAYENGTFAVFRQCANRVSCE